MHRLLGLKADEKKHIAMHFIKVSVPASAERFLLATSSSSAVENLKFSAIGVVYRDAFGHYHHTMVRDNGGEVILSSGAMGSPQLLLLSGIGSRPYLFSS